MATRWLETDTNSNIDISSATLIGTYTFDGDRWVAAQLLADQVAGNGDYVAYCTLQVGGTGSAYVMLGKTTLTAASGETAIGGQTIFIFGRNTDVLKVYIDGLAGDTTTPDTTVRFAELDALRPATVDRTADIDASGRVLLQPTQTGVTIPTVTTLTNAPSDSAGVTTLLSRLSAARAGYLDYLAGWTATIFAEIAAVIWTYATRNLTSTAASATAAVAGSALSITKHVDYDATLTSLTISASWTKEYITVKRNPADDDSEAVLQIVKSNPAAASTDGILYVNGAAATAAQRTKGSLTVTQGSGTIAIHLDDDLTTVLEAGNFSYDRKELTATTSAKTSASAPCSIDETETHSVS